MVKKKVKPAKSAKKRGGSWQVEDVQVHTGLPPQVEGQLRCFCRLSIGQILWLVPNAPEVTLVRVKWWGEPGQGALFSPLDVKRGSTAHTRTTARYPVRSGPRQFSAYLNDMSSLGLEVLSGDQLLPVGHSEVTQIGLLSPGRPINGFFPVFSPTEEKIGEIHASLVLESLMASYDSTGSIPTTDVSMETYASHVTQESTVPKKSQPVPHSEPPRKPVEDPFISPASHQAGQSRMTGGYMEDLRERLNYGPDPAERPYHRSLTNGDTVAITTNGDVVTTQYDREKEVPIAQSQPQTGGGSDLLSVLLDRGNKLREQMIISAIDTKSSEPQAAPRGQSLPTELSAPSATDPNISTVSVRSSNGSFLREILKAEKALVGETADVEESPVDLVFGGSLLEDIRMLKNINGSPNSSISSGGDVSSDPGDPIHSQSLLEDLFYKQMMSGGSDLSDLSGDEIASRKLQKNLDDPTNMRPPSRHSSMTSLNLAFPEPEYPKSKTVKTPKRKSRAKLKRKGSKKHRSSKSRSRGSVSEGSDSEAVSTVSTPRSECSRVSFDMVPSDIDEPAPRDPSKTRTADGLSVERLTLLGRVSVARVTIDHLQLSGKDLDTSTTKPRSKLKYGTKPPRPSPKSKKASTYFIEYQFPVVATSRDKYSPNTMATEVMRVVSRNVKNNVVGFNHRSVFPVMFDGTAVERWWKSALVFKIFSKTAGQKVPILIGSCGIPLKSILKSESLHIDRRMDVRDSGKNSSLNSSQRATGEDVGSLKIILELASDSKEFPTALAKTRLAEMSGKAKIVPIPQASQAPRPQPAPSGPDRVSVKPPTPQAPLGLEAQARARDSEQTSYPAASTSSEHQAQGSSSLSDPVSVQRYYGNQSVIKAPVMYQDPSHVGAESLTLHTMVLIPDGKGISMQGIPSLLHAKRRPVFPQPTCLAAPGVRARDLSVRNTYLVCRMFWCDESVHSDVCWGTTDPAFNFNQIAPVLVSQSLLERLRNNFMVVEVWDKKTSSDNDKLVGIVKLSLHQFYLSFRDKKIAAALLKSQYPVISVDNYLPVVDPFSGSQFGQIKVLVAMGSAEQIAHLQRLKVEGSAMSVPDRPQHFLERQDVVNQVSLPTHIGTECVVEHVFEVVLEGIRGLTLFENMIWGEADCFVQYHFPTQTQSQPPGAPVIRHAVPTMKAFRTATTLCIPDPTFNDVTRHRILLPQGTPVQRELLTACANSGGGSGGIPFEIWCRYYHPNVRDQCIAKASLPLAKLCAMITMQKRGEASVQTFSIPLTPIPSDSDTTDKDAKTKNMESGLMDITLHYKTQIVQSEVSGATNKNLSGAQVCVSVGVIRATGLKTAAENAARLDTGMQYPAEVGVNSYVKVKLSFLKNEGERVTRTVARSFSPEYSHFMDFPCPLLWTEADSDALCLAEILESAEATFEVWHQVPGLSSDLDKQLASLGDGEVKGRRLVEKTKDVLLGSTTLPLNALLTHRTGYTGWFPVNIPVSGWNGEPAEGREAAQEEEGSGQEGLHRVGGGLELSVKFAHHEDRERVIHAARGVGWSPVDLDVEQDDWESEDEDSNRYHHVSITIDHLCFPLHNALIAGQNHLDKTAQCYIRYKFYDKAAVMSKFASVSVNNSGYITSQPRNKHDLQIADSSPYRWYLREERLEIQVWVSYGTRKDDAQRPKHRDKLIGSAYISMETLSDQRRKQHRVSGMYPLMKPGASSLGGAYLRAHITSRPQFGVISQQGQGGDMTVLEGQDLDEDYDPDDSFHQLIGPSRERPASPMATSDDKTGNAVEVAATFTVMIAVERAMHLPRMTDKTKSDEFFPNTYVSYSTAESTIQSYTSVFFNSDNPVWDHEHETQLSTELLSQENKNLVFKVWHKPAGSPKDPDKLTDRVLGFVSVDLTPLASGLLQVCGWYNIMDFNGQVKGQIKINVIPQESVIQSQQADPTQGALLGHPNCASFLSLPPWGGTAPPAPDPLAPLSLPHYEQHYESVKQHHELLQQQLQDHIQQFLRQQEENQAAGVDVGAAVNREPSIHWQPSIPDLRQEESSSRSVLFSSLRRNLSDLDEITKNLKSRLTVGGGGGQSMSRHRDRQLPEFEIPVTSQSGSYPLTSTQSTIASYELPRSQRETPRDDLALTGSQGGDTSRTAADSGAFSADHSNDKYDQEAPDSQRSGSDRHDTFRLGATPRDYMSHLEFDSGYAPRDVSNNANNDELAFNIGLTPRESAVNEDEYSASGGFSVLKNSPRDVSRASPRDVVGITGDELAVTPRDRVSANDNTVPNQTSVTENGAQTRAELQGREEPKQMSIIQEFPEQDDSGSDEERGHSYYHRYRDILDAEDDDRKSEESDTEEEGDIIVPRRINDVSGKFTPTGEIIMLNQDGSQSVPYAVTSVQSDMYSPRSVPNTRDNGDQRDVYLEHEEDPRPLRLDTATDVEQVVFDERDSWLSESDKETEEHGDSVVNYMFDPETVHTLNKHKQRQDSDTGYSSRDNVSESYLGPGAVGTHLDTDILHPRGNDQWEEPEDVFSDKRKRNLLSNVELESTLSGSRDLKLDYERTSRLSSAGSGHSQRTMSEHSAEFADRQHEEHGSNGPVNSNTDPLSARSEELSNFFGLSHTTVSNKVKRLRSLSESSEESDFNPDEYEAYERSAKSCGEPVVMDRVVNGDIYAEDVVSDSDDQCRDREPVVTRTEKTVPRPAQDRLPNFFMPVKHLEESMRTLQVVTDQDSDVRRLEKAEAAAAMSSKLTVQGKLNQVPSKARPLPTAEETKRIAKIFSSKFT